MRKTVLVVSFSFLFFCSCTGFKQNRKVGAFNYQGVFTSKGKDFLNTLILYNGRFILSGENIFLNKICSGSYKIISENEILLVCSPLSPAAPSLYSAGYVFDRKIKVTFINEDKLNVSWQNLSLERDKCEHLK